jgi:TPR repeat protein
MGLFDMLKKRKAFVSLDTIIAADCGDERAKDELDKAFNRGMTAEEHNSLRRQAYYSNANEGDPIAQYWMGFLCSMIDRDVNMTIYWYECSAKQGNIEAMRALALGYGEFINNSDLDYGPVPLGYDKDKELYWLQMVANYSDK